VLDMTPPGWSGHDQEVVRAKVQGLEGPGNASYLSGIERSVATDDHRRCPMKLKSLTSPLLASARFAATALATPPLGLLSGQIASSASCPKGAS